jgi:hypothetical protein
MGSFIANNICMLSIIVFIAKHLICSPKFIIMSLFDKLNQAKNDKLAANLKEGEDF